MTQNTLKLYHGTLVAGIGSFVDASHFGTREQALHAIVVKGFVNNDDERPVTPHIYHCEIQALDSEVHMVGDDWASPRPAAALNKYLRSIGKSELQTQLWAEHNLIHKHQSPVALRLLQEEMKHNGHTVLSYDNDVEGEGVSYMVAEGSMVAIIHVEVPSKREIFEHFLRVRHRLVPSYSLALFDKRANAFMGF